MKQITSQTCLGSVHLIPDRGACGVWNVIRQFGASCTKPHPLGVLTVSYNPIS